MSRWPWRRRTGAGAPAPEPAGQLEPELGATPEPELEPSPDHAADSSGGISPARLDEALRRLRERTPAREDDPPVQPGG
jgi:hypothetical protein